MSDEQQTSVSTRWIKSADIKNVTGAHKPSTYVARAYAFQKQNHGSLPHWARKAPGGIWLFDETYIVRCARENIDTIGVSEAARLLGVTRRTIQTWVDDDVIPVSEHRPGEVRRILRGPFMEAIPGLRKRLETAPVVGYRVKHGLPVEEHVRTKIETTRDQREQQRKQSENTRSRREAETRLKARLQRKAAEKEARLTIKMNRQLESAERKLNDVRQRKVTLEKEIKQRVEQERIEGKRADAIRSDYEARLAKSSRLAEKLVSQRQRSERKLDGNLGMEAAALSDVEKLREAVSVQLDNYRRQSAQAIATQLRDAAAPGKTQQATDESRRVRQSAEAVAARLHQARDACARTTALEEQAIELASGIADDMPEGSMARIDGAILFNDIAEQRDIPSDIRIKITRQFFSRRG